MGVALDDAPQSAKAHYNWGNYLVAINSSLLAKKHFEDAVETFPQFAAAKGALGLALAEDLQYEAALNELIGDLDIQLEDSAYTYKPEPKNMLMGPNQLLLLITELRVYNTSINRPPEHLNWLDDLIAKCLGLVARDAFDALAEVTRRGLDVSEAGDPGEGLSERAHSVAGLVGHPAKVMRIGSMIKQLLEEVRSAPLDEASRARLREIHQRSITELESGLAPVLIEELDRLSLPFGSDSVPTDSELLKLLTEGQ